MDAAPALAPFLVTGPVWFLARPGAEGAVNFVTVEDTGRAYIPVFTDTDLAGRYVEAHCGDIPGVAALGATTAGAARDLFAALAGQGHTHVGFDPGGRCVRVFPIAAVIAAYAAACDPGDA